jgi:hypothetical protein
MRDLRIIRADGQLQQVRFIKDSVARGNRYSSQIQQGQQARGIRLTRQTLQK